MGSTGTPNGDTSLPNRNSPDVHLVVATQEENIAQQQANSTEWRGVLTLDGYFRREVHLSGQELTKDGGLTVWVLVHQPEGHKNRKVLCGCETVRKKALIGRNGKVEDVITHGVGSVFCPVENRGKGYAGRMMTELGKKLGHLQGKVGEKPLFSVLYSDIGKEFYAARGWHPFPSSHVSLPAVPSASGGLPQVRVLKTDDLAELCSIDEKLVRSRLSKFKDGDKSAVAILPDSITVRWHHAREEFVARELFDRKPVIKGAVCGQPGARVWCYWTRVWTNPQEDAPNTLHILRLVIEDESCSTFAPASPESVAKMKDSPTAKAIAALFSAAQAEAAQWDMKEALLWNPTSTALAAAQILNPQATVEHRERESIASLRWYGEGSHENVDWVCNEKYGWF